MIIRLLAVAALVVSTGASIATAQEGQTGQQCNCPKCQAARKAHEEAMATYSAMPAGLFAEPQAPNTTVQPTPQPAAQPEVQQAFHHHQLHGSMPTNQCPPGAYPGYGAGYNGAAMPYYNHPGHIYAGGHYGPYGGAHGTPGYPRHHHMHREYVGPQGPPSAAVAYPYYTVRGPRDFFLDNPPSIGR